VPTITPGYLYSFLALLAVSGLLVASFMAYANTLRSSSETRLLKSLIDEIASKCTGLVTLTALGAPHARASVEMPTSLGDNQYWIRLVNDSDQAWVGGGLGDIVNGYGDLRTYLPKDVYATGIFVGGYGAADLECHLDVKLVLLSICSANQGELT